MALKQAVRWRLIARNVCEDVTPPRETQSHERQILTPEQAQQLLAAAKGHRLEAKLKAGPKWEEHDLVFCNMYGRFLSTSYLQVLFSTLVKQAGLPHMRLHDLRHSAATILLAMGVPIKVVQELSGHSSITITLKVYGHVLSSMQQEAMDKLDDLFGKCEVRSELLRCRVKSNGHYKIFCTAL